MKNKTNELVLQGLIAASYVAITFVFQSVSFMPQQFRISEILIILVLVHPKNTIGIVIGTLIANIFSSVGPVDIVVGTFATYVSLWLMVRVKIKWLKYLSPAIANGVIVGIMLAIVLDMNVFIAMGSVFVSEVVVTFVPWLLIGDRILKNKGIREMFG